MAIHFKIRNFLSESIITNIKHYSPSFKFYLINIIILFEAQLLDFPKNKYFQHSTFDFEFPK